MASMIAPIASYWISVERRRLVQVIPEPVRNIWSRWEIRGPVISSLLIQAHLAMSGRMRKTEVSVLGRASIWMSYLLADPMANFALDMIFSEVGDFSADPSRKPEDNLDPELMAFWAACMLVHFGGPDSITSYALEDNALWPRNLAHMSFQSLRVFYIILLVWRSTWLSYISIAVLIVGAIKCWERTRAQYSATIDRLRDMLIPPLVEETEVENSHVIEAMTLADDARYLPSWVLLENFMRFFVSLFVDLVYTNKDLREARTYILQLPSKKAFKLVEDELGYAYDIFYTKAYVRYSLGGTILQFATISITVMVLVCFKSMVVPRYRLSDKDRVITYTLLAGALVLEIYAILERFVSKGILVWLKEKLSRCWVSSPREKMPSWSHSLPCYDFLTLCLEYNNYVPDATLSKFHKQLLHRRRISEDLKSRIFDHMKKSSMNCLNDVIDEQGRPESIMWTKTLEFHQSILTWHIATQMCYYCGSDDSPGREYDDALIFKDISKNLSEYMLFLLVDQRYMLPVGTGLISFRDTRAETIQFLRQEDVCVGPLLPSNGILLYKVCEMLMHDEDAGKRKKYSKSVLRDACRLARSLTQMERRKLWELLADVWVEILGHAAINCRADHHAQQLRRGGEFLSHVWLLMAHLGLMEQFKLTQP